MQKNVIESIYSYITKFLKRKYPWQVASSFVTHILDINEQSMEDGAKIKVLKPAEDFY
jgi:disulfide oxidoreductase YuzD